MSGGEEPLGFLRYAGRPPGQDHVVKAAAAAWHGAADGIRQVADRLDREVARVAGPRWRGAGAVRVLEAWDALRRDAHLVEGLLRDTGTELDKLSTSIRDAQQDWDRTMAALAVTVGISIGLGVVSFGLSNLAAGGAARAAAAATVGIAGWLEGIVQGSGVVLLALAEASGAITARLAVGFGVNLATQSISGAITSSDHSFDRVLGARELNGGFGAGAGKLLDAAVVRRLRGPATQTAASARATPSSLPKPLPHGVFRVSKDELDPNLVRVIARRLGLDPGSLEPRMLEAGTRGWSGADVWMLETPGAPAAVAKVFTVPRQGAREHQAIQRLHRETFPRLGVVDEVFFAPGRTDAGAKASILVMSVAPGDSNHAILQNAGEWWGRKRAKALKVAERAVTSGARALADLHTVPPGSGGPVSQAYVEESIGHLMETAHRLDPVRPLLTAHIDIDAIAGRLAGLSEGYRANPGGASLVHGDAHPGNFHYDAYAATTVIDTPNLPFSMDASGNPAGSPARDYTAYLMKIRSFGVMAELKDNEIIRLQGAADLAYTAAGGPDLTPEALSFFRARVALADLAREARVLVDAGSRVELTQHPALGEAIKQAKAVFGL